MIKKFCSRCGKLYDALNDGHCNCKASQKALAERRKMFNDTRKQSSSFYNSTAWVKVANAMRRRDGDKDLIQFFLFVLLRKNALIDYYPASLPKIYEDAFRRLIDKLRASLIDANDYPRMLGIDGDLLVHHIIPRNEDYSLQYRSNNLITISAAAHNVIHEFYNRNSDCKIAAQSFLKDILSKQYGYQYEC